MTTDKELNDIIIGMLCHKYNIKNYTINPDGSIDVDGGISGGVRFNNLDIDHIPLTFNYVQGYFDCENLPNLKSLKGSPRKTTGTYLCRNCPSLTSLEGGPDVVKIGHYYIEDCESLSSLKGAPTFVYSHIDFVGKHKIPKTDITNYLIQMGKLQAP